MRTRYDDTSVSTNRVSELSRILIKLEQVHILESARESARQSESHRSSRILVNFLLARFQFVLGSAKKSSVCLTTGKLNQQ